MNEIKSYYSAPTMVSFINPDTDEDTVDTIIGIAYNESIICACCGGVWDIPTLIKAFEEQNEDFDPEFEELNWIPFDEYIM